VFFLANFHTAATTTTQKRKRIKKKTEKVVQSVRKIGNKFAKSTCFEAQKKSSEVAIFRQ
jgi:hypothetical protein